MKIVFTVLLSITIVGCSSSMYQPHYQVNSPTANGLATTATPSDNQAIIDARLHVQQDYDGVGVCIGAGFRLFGIAGSYLYEGEIPIKRLRALEGKPINYQLLYRREYVNEIKRIRTKESILGYATFLVIFALYM